MGLAKQAKVLSKRQIALTAALLAQTRYPTRNLAIFLLSVKAGLRAKDVIGSGKLTRSATRI